MGVAYYPKLEPAVPGLEPHLMVSGKAIAKAMPALEDIAKELGIRPVSDYYSESTAEQFAHIGEKVPPGTKDIPIVWSDPVEGLATVRALTTHLKELGQTHIVAKHDRNRDQSVAVDRILTDLNQLETVLSAAARSNSKFRLCIDM